MLRHYGHVSALAFISIVALKLATPGRAAHLAAWHEKRLAKARSYRHKYLSRRKRASRRASWSVHGGIAVVAYQAGENIIKYVMAEKARKMFGRHLFYVIV